MVAKKKFSVKTIIVIVTIVKLARAIEKVAINLSGFYALKLNNQVFKTAKIIGKTMKTCTLLSPSLFLEKSEIRLNFLSFK